MTTSNFEPAYLLHTRPYRESSLLGELLVAERGRVGVVMRGARSGKRAPAQLFQPLLVQLGGHGELKTLKSVETAGSLLPLTGVALFSGFYLNELLVRLLQRELPLPRLFLAYVNALAAFSTQPVTQQDVEPILRQFEKTLLDELGYGFTFGTDSENGEPVRAGCYYSFLPERGFSQVAGAADSFEGGVLLELAAGNYTAAAPRFAAKQILRQALARQLGGKPLKSRELFLKP